MTTTTNKNTVISMAARMMLVVAFAAGCAPNAGNEVKHWENHQKAAAEFKLAYPGFGVVIDAKIAAAGAAFAAATKETDEAKKAEQMKAANAIVAEILSPLNEIKYKGESLRGVSEKISALKVGKGDAGRQSEAASAARSELAKVQAALAAARPATLEEAVAALRPQISALIAAKGAADRALAALSKKK
jgi:hypothetical protein